MHISSMCLSSFCLCCPKCNSSARQFPLLFVRLKEAQDAPTLDATVLLRDEAAPEKGPIDAAHRTRIVRRLTAVQSWIKAQISSKIDLVRGSLECLSATTVKILEAAVDKVVADSKKRAFATRVFEIDPVCLFACTSLPIDDASVSSSRVKFSLGHRVA